MTQPTILFVLTSADKLLDGKPTGWYLPEAAHPYYKLRPHFNIVFASPKGGAAPLDQNSVNMFKDEESVKFNTSDLEAKHLVANTIKVSDVKVDDYVAIFVVGGHGPLIDLTGDSFARLVERFYAQGKPVAAVCHGPAALTSARKPNHPDQPLLKGVKSTGFSNAEEAQTPYNDFVNTLPFSLEDKMKELGGLYEKADADWGVHVVNDQGILTGQNPASAALLGSTLKDILVKG